MDLGELDKPSARIPRVRLGLLDGATLLLLEDVECLHVRDELPNLDRRQEWEGGADHHFWLAPRVLRQEDIAGARSVIRVVAENNPPLLQYVRRRAGGVGGIGGSSGSSGIGTGTGTGASSGIDIGTSSGTSTGIGIGMGTSTGIGTSSTNSDTRLKTHASSSEWHARSCTCALALLPIGERRA